MVEKWLLQVEEMMLASVRQVIENGIEGYIEVIVPELQNKIDLTSKYVNRLLKFLARETHLKLSRNQLSLFRSTSVMF